MANQGRLGDHALMPAEVGGCPLCPHVATGPAVSGSANVHVNGKPALRVDDIGVHAACCKANSWRAKVGSGTVHINGRKAHRQGDMVKGCCGVGNLIEGSGNVHTGG